VSSHTRDHRRTQTTDHYPGITIPWALTLASLVCLILIEISGWSSSGSPAGNFYFLRADFSNFTTASASTLANTTTLTAALENAKATNQLRVDYDVHLWNYCTSDRIDGTINTCMPKQAQFYFDPVAVWGLNSTNTTSSPAVAAPYNLLGGAVNSGINTVQSDAETYENELLGKSGKEALDAYRHVAKWMFIAYEISFWTTLATLICSVLAVFSRWGSFLTWIFSIVRLLLNPTHPTIISGTELTKPRTGLLPHHPRRGPNLDSPLRRPDRGPRDPPETLQHPHQPRPPRADPNLARRPLLLGRDLVLAGQRLLLLGPQ